MVDVRVRGGGSVKVGKIVCLLRNYRAHAAEMKSAPPREPFFFLKPATAIIPDGGTIIIPRKSKNVHHEAELAVVIGKKATNISRTNAMSHVMGYAVMIDVTARDIQDEAKKEGRPWAAAKGFDTFAPISDVMPSKEVGDPHALDISLMVNGEVRQKGSTSMMIFKIDEVIGYVSSVMTLEPGDIIATGTPEGVAQIRDGDTIEAEIDKVGRLRVRVAAQK